MLHNHWATAPRPLTDHLLHMLRHKNWPFVRFRFSLFDVYFSISNLAIMCAAKNFHGKTGEHVHMFFESGKKAVACCVSFHDVACVKEKKRLKKSASFNDQKSIRKKDRQPLTQGENAKTHTLSKCARTFRGVCYAYKVRTSFFISRGFLRSLTV